jgi:hypothetical protein
MNLLGLIFWFWDTVMATGRMVLAIVRVVIGLCFIGVVGYLIYYGIQVLRTSGCKSRWQQSGLEFQWELGVGCLIYVDGRWVPEANVQVQPKKL